MAQPITFYRPVILLLGILLLAGCQSEPDPAPQSRAAASLPDSVHSLGRLTIHDGWLRPGPAGGNSAAYFSVYNGGAAADTLLRVSAPGARRAEIHTAFTEDGMSGMRPAGPQPIEAGGHIVLKPGELHVMLMNLNRDLAVGDSMEVRLYFSGAGTRSLKLPARIP